MVKFKIKNSIFKTMSLLYLNDNLKATIFINPSSLNPILDSSVNSIKWSARVQHIFFKRRLIKIRDLVKSLEKMRTFRNFGKKCHNEVIVKLSNHFEKNMKPAKFKNSVSKLANSLNNNAERRFLSMNKGVLGLVVNDRIDAFAEILCNKDKTDRFLNCPIEKINWSVRNINIFKKYDIKTVKDFSKFSDCELLSKKNFGKKCFREIFDKLEDFAKEPEETTKPLDLENLVKFLLIKISARGRKIISRRYGLWNGERATLEKISKDFGVTRERIRQIQEKQIKALQSMYGNDVLIRVSLKELFNKKLKPFLEANNNVANLSELLEIIYRLDDEKIGVDLANEFLSEVIFDKKPIFSDFVISFDTNVIGLYEQDRRFYLKMVKLTNAYLKEKKIPQSASELIQYFVKSNFIQDVSQEREKINRLLAISNIAKDTTGKLGLKEWRYFNSDNIHGMAERALIEINKPAHFTQIALLMNELFPEYGPFDSHNVHARIGSRKDIFVWVAPGVFGLKRWGLERPPYVKDYLVKLLKKASKPMHITELTERVLEKCNCRTSSVSLTLDINEDAFIKYPEKFYGLISWK